MNDDYLHTDLRKLPGKILDDLLTALALALFVIQFLFVATMQYLTRFSPFSHFFRNRMYHYNNRDLQEMQREIDILLFLNNYRASYIEAEKDYYFLTLTLHLEPIKKWKNKEKQYKLIEEHLSKEDILFRPLDKNFVRIMKPIHH
jgi:spore germination protein GerM